jgi:Prenyltransferase and squalene oxidase repeat
MPALTRNRMPVGQAGTPDVVKVPIAVEVAAAGVRSGLGSRSSVRRGPVHARNTNMRTTRHLAKVALAAIVVTSVSGFVVQSHVSAAATPAAAAQSAFQWMEAELNDNAGMLPFPPFGGLPPAVDWGMTIDTILALNLGGRGADAPATTATTELAAHVNDYITGDAFGDLGSHYAGPIGKTMVAAELQGADVNSFGGVNLEALSRGVMKTSGLQTGRFSDVSMFGDFGNGFGQALNTIGLARTPDGVPSDAADFLLAQQCPAGGFRLDYGDDTVDPVTRGCESDAEADTDATAFAIQAVLALDPNPTTATAVAHAASWLIDQQDPATGGFGGTGPTASVNANTSGLAAQALNAAGFVDAAARARTYVATLQLDATNTAGTAVVGEEGAIVHDQGAFDDALANGLPDRDGVRRTTPQAVLAFDLPAFVPPRSDVVSVTPSRLLDTRPGQSTIDGKASGAGLTAAGSTLVLQVAGRADVPADAAAVVLNVTAEGGQGPGFVTVYPCDAPQPLSSSLNFVAGTPVANAVVTGLSASGTVCLYVGTNRVNLIADVSGFFPPSSGYQALNPARLLDTRAGESTVDGSQVGSGLEAAGSTLVLPVAERGGVPFSVDSVVLNVTAVGGQGDGVVTVYPCDAPRPLASNLNFVAGTATANTVITGVSAAGTVCLYVGTNGVNLVADVNGFFPTGSGYKALTPARLLDSRAGQSTVDGAQSGAGRTAAGSTLVLPVASRGGVPTGATSVVLNVTAVDGQGPGFVTVYPCDAAQPFASNLNFVANTPTPNAAIVKLSAAGTVCLFVGTNPVDLVVDVSGYFG